MTYCKPGASTFPGSAGCQKCDSARRAELIEAGADQWDHPGVMILCSTCGNKRCPKATFHGNDCTGLNAPNQPGSSYQICCCEWAETDDRWFGQPSKPNPACTVDHEDES